MLEVMKVICTTKFEDWTKRIENSAEKTTTIDISVEFVDIMARNIITIAFGEDINDELFELPVRKCENSSEFVIKMIKLGDAIKEVWE